MSTIQNQIDALYARRATTGGHGRRARITAQIEALEEQLKLAAVADGATADELLGYDDGACPPECPGCGYDGATNVLGDWGDWQIIRCRACGLVYYS